MSHSIKHQHLVKSFSDTRLPIETAGHFATVTTVLYQAWNHLEAPPITPRMSTHGIEVQRRFNRPIVHCKKFHQNLFSSSFCVWMRRCGHICRGDAKGQHGAVQISLKCHLKQTSSDRVMPFRCPSPSLKIKLCCGAKADGDSYNVTMWSRHDRQDCKLEWR